MSENEPDKMESDDTQPATQPATEGAPEQAAEASPDAAAGDAVPAEAMANSDAADATSESPSDSPPDSPPDSPSDSPWAGDKEAPDGEDGVDPAARVADLEAQVAELNDKLLRALAEAENVRRRAQRDREDTAKYGIKNFAEGMLSIADNLGRAMASIDADARAADANLENIFVGVEMVQKDLVSTFERYGVTPIKALGAKFDPMLHEAMYEIEDTETATGTIAHVLEPGYVLHGRTLRAAKVGITKGGPKEAPAATPAEEAADPATDADPAARDGQAAYESQTDPKTASGGNLDREL